MADSAELNEPSGVAIDLLGNLFISDSYNNRIRIVNLGTGMIYTIAGDGISGFSGDGGIANLAELDYPENVAFDASDNMYIADNGNNRIRKVSAPLGIKELSSGVRVEVYPNPSSGVFAFSFLGSHEKANLIIYNMLGEKVYSTQFNSNAIQIDLIGRPAGVYMYRVVNENGEAVTNGKLIIQ